ncbi:MAG: hypothetical protein P4L39_11770 [Humidesulfovibrio sp.]|nr:hypothetical protein [Humidesulfovibrio sp.]
MRRKTHGSAFWALVLALVLGLWTAEGQCMQQAFLVQNSGWMEPFFVDPASPFKTLVAHTAETVSSPGDVISVLAFNQSAPGNESPRQIYQEPSASGVRQALDQLGLAHKGEGKTLANTDFNEAVIKTISATFHGQPGIIWIFTNNKNSPNNNAQTAARNREFYDLVHNQPAIARTLTLPLAMPVVGKSYTANGLMVYALAYGPPADKHLQALLDSGCLAKIFTQVPAQLKPLDRDAIRIMPRKVLDASGVSASLGHDKRTLVVDVDAESRQPLALVVAGLENLFYPYVIKSASVSAQVATAAASSPLQIAPDTISDLAPGKAVEARVTIPISIDRPSPWTLKGLLQAGRSIAVPAQILVRLDNQKLSLDNDFRKRMQEIFPGDPLPDVFLPPANITASEGRIPLLVRVNYPLYPLLLAMALLLGLGGAGLFLLSRRGTADSYNIFVDGTPRRVSLARFSSVDIYSGQDQKIAVLRRGLGQPTVQSVTEGHTVSISR